MTKLIAAALTAALTIAACGGDDDDDDDGASGSGTTQAGALDTPTTTAAAGVPDVAVEYLDLLAAQDLGGMARMVALAADGSPAELYATHQQAIVRYTGPGTVTTNTVKDETIEECGGDAPCTVFGDFAVDDAGLLVSFSTDGKPIADRIRAGDPAGVTDGGATARVLTAYLNAAGDLFITVDVTNGGEGVAQVDDCSATYVGPDGRQVSQECISTHPRVQPGATATVGYIVNQAPLGGTLSITAATDEREAGTFYSSVAINLPVPA